MLKKFSILAVAALLAAPISANAATIEFGDHIDGALEDGNDYIEDGFTLSWVSGVEYGIARSAGNDDSNDFGSGLIVGYGNAPAVNDTLTFKRNNGGLFTFDFVDYVAAGYADNATSHGIVFVGRRNNVEIFVIENVTSITPDMWLMLIGEMGTYIDELQIVVASTGGDGLYLDNFRFSEVPLPAAVWMFLAGLGGLGFARGKKRSV